MGLLRESIQTVKDLFSFGSKIDEFRIQDIKIDNIVSNPYQPRSNIDEDNLERLADSIDQYGIINPIIVTPLEDGVYQLVSGERRVRASKLLNREKIPAVMREYSDEELMEISFLDNLQREPMNPIDKAQSYQRLRDEFVDTSIEELARTIGVPHEEIEKIDWMLELPVLTQRALVNEIINPVWALFLFEVDEQHHKSIIRFIAEENPSHEEIYAKIQEFSPDIGFDSVESLNDGSRELDDFLKQESLEFLANLTEIVSDSKDDIEDVENNGVPPEDGKDHENHQENTSKNQEQSDNRDSDQESNMDRNKKQNVDSSRNGI